MNYTTATSVCIDETMTLVWHPGAVTTYALPVMEIEMIVHKLSYLLNQNITAADASKLNKLISNWNSVLSDYRSHNTDLTSMFSANTMQFNSAVKHFNDFRTGQLDAQDFASAVANTLDGVLDFPYITSMAYAMNGAFFQIKETCDQVLPYTVGTTLVGASENTGGAGPTLKAVCDDFDPDSWQSLASMINGACAGVSSDGEPSNPLSSTPLFKQLCASENINGDSIPGGLQTSSGPETLLGYLNDSKKLITLGANSPVKLSWTSTVSESKAFNVEFKTARSMGINPYLNIQIKLVAFGIMTKNGAGLTNMFTIHLGKSSVEQHANERTVTVSLGDGDGGDFFAVRITEDPVYGTPVFTTMGGASKCPGETGTSRRESNVRIVEIRERCGADKASPCNELTLGPGDNANFGVVIENLSPTQDEVYYTLQVADPFDDYLGSGGDGNYTCGVSGQGSGLVVLLSSTDIERIPYLRQVEVPFTVTHVFNGPISLCNEFNDIRLRIIATCEQPTPHSAVYQYGVEYNPETHQTEVMYDPAHHIYASNSTATFSVKWPSVRRRLSEISTPGLSQADGSDAADAVAELLLREFRESKLSMEAKMTAMAMENKAAMDETRMILCAMMVALILLALRRSFK